MAEITYTDKVIGSKFTAANANEIKDSVNDLYEMQGDDADAVQKIRVVLWGDSLTAGYRVLNANYGNQLAQSLGLSVSNQGVSGETSSQILTRFNADAEDWIYPTIIWSGRNNISNPTQIKADIASMVSSLGHTNYLILSVLNQDVPAEYIGQPDYVTITTLNNDLGTIYGAHYLDVRAYLLTQGNGSGGDNTDIANGVPPRSLRNTGDPLHLNGLGYSKIAAYIVANGVSFITPEIDKTLSIDSLRTVFNNAPDIGGDQLAKGYFNKFQIGSNDPSFSDTDSANALLTFVSSGTPLHVYQDPFVPSTLVAAGHLRPNITNTYDLGTSAIRYRQILGTTLISGTAQIGTPATTVQPISALGTNAAPSSSGSAQNGTLRLEATGLTTTVLDQGVDATNSFSWLQSRSGTDYSVNRELRLNHQGGTVSVGSGNTVSNQSFTVNTSATANNSTSALVIQNAAPLINNRAISINLRNTTAGGGGNAIFSINHANHDGVGGNYDAFNISMAGTGSTTTINGLTALNIRTASTSRITIDSAGTAAHFGGIKNQIRTISATTTALVSDWTMLCDATSGAITLNLPTAASAFTTTSGQVYNIKKINNTANNITIDPSGAELIDGAATLVLSTFNQCVAIQSNGTSWFVINQ